MARGRRPAAPAAARGGRAAHRTDPNVGHGSALQLEQSLAVDRFFVAGRRLTAEAVKVPGRLAAGPGRVAAEGGLQVGRVMQDAVVLATAATGRVVAYDPSAADGGGG